MIVEALPSLLVGLLPLVGISFKIKEEIRKEHPEYGQKRIEVAHVLDHFLGGNGERTNLIPLTLPEHLLDHVTKAEQAEDYSVADRQYGAASMIAKRMTPEELKEANNMLIKRKR